MREALLDVFRFVLMSQSSASPLSDTHKHTQPKAGTPKPDEVKYNVLLELKMTLD